MTQSNTTDRIHEARESLASARSLVDTADAGLSKIETISEKADSARRRPLLTTVVFFALALLGTLIVMSVRGE